VAVERVPDALLVEDEAMSGNGPIVRPHALVRP
jgi:hypothetical protein